MHLDLGYLSGGSAGHLAQNFYLHMRALCYVISGLGLRQWHLDLQVTQIPTFDSAVMHRWYEKTHEQHQAVGIRVLGSGSLVSM